MSSTRTSSPASADRPPGTTIAGYRLERVIGRGSRATVYAATQVALDRRVAFKLLHDRSLAERVRRIEWPEHPGAVDLFGAGDSEHGPWLAMRLLPGETLATHPAPLDQVAAALAHAHAAGIVHGDVTAANVLVADGRAYLTDFGLAAQAATDAEDDAALARLVREQPATHRRRRGSVLVVAGLAATLAIVLAAVLASSASHSNGPAAATAAAPPVTAGTTAIGSDLAPGASATVDCSGSPPSGASRACGVSQLTLAGRAIVVPFDGTIVAWAVRAARGTVALQVLRERDGRLVAVDRTGDELVRGPAPRVFRTDLAVAAGDRVALELTPGAAVGIRSGAAGTSTERWFGALRDIPLAPDEGAGSGFDHELLLRIDVSRHVRTASTAPLRGRLAADAWPGFVLASRDVAVGGGAERTVAVVSLGGSVAIDLFDGTRRLARTPIAGADGRGRLDRFTTAAGTVRVRWQNPSGQRLDRAYTVTASAVG